MKKTKLIPYFHWYNKLIYIKMILVLFICLTFAPSIYSNNRILEWEKVEGVLYYKVEVAKDSKFKINKKSFKAKNDNYLLDLKPGIYYVRVAGVWSGGKGPFSAVYQVEIKPNAEPDKKLRLNIPERVFEAEPAITFNRKIKRKNNKKIRLSRLKFRQLVKWDKYYKLWVPSSFHNLEEYNRNKKMKK